MLAAHALLRTTADPRVLWSPTIPLLSPETFSRQLCIFVRRKKLSSATYFNMNCLRLANLLEQRFKSMTSTTPRRTPLASSS